MGWEVDSRQNREKPLGEKAVACSSVVGSCPPPNPHLLALSSATSGVVKCMIVSNPNYHAARAELLMVAGALCRCKV